MGEHGNKWWVRMIAKHGSEEAVRAFMRATAEKSSRNKKGSGGFAYIKQHDPERFKEIVSRGGQNGSRRRKDAS